MGHLRITTACAAIALLSLGSGAAGQPADEPRGDRGEGASAIRSGDGVEGGDAVATGAALVPGVLVRGSGLWVAGHRRTARRVFWLSNIGLAAAVAGAVPLAATGANRRVNEVAIPLLVSGLGVFGLGWVADIYGSAGGAARGAGPSFEGAHQIRAGLAYVHDPQFDYGPFSALDSQHRFGRWVVRPSLWVASSADNQRGYLELARRFVQPRSWDGTRLELAGRGSYHRYGDDSFWVGSGEVAVRGRLDLQRIGAVLGGSFAEVGLGMGVERVDFAIEPQSAYWSDYLLAEFGYGFYFGNHGELRLYYDHRRDDFGAGISPGTGPGSGFAGHLGAGGQVWLGRNWGVGADVHIGSALVSTLGLVLRTGEGR